MPIPKPRLGWKARRPGAQNFAYQPRRTGAQSVPAVVKTFDRNDVDTRIEGGNGACEPGFARAGAAIERNDYLPAYANWTRSEEHTSELQSRGHLVCRLLLEKKKQNKHIA